MLIDEDEDDDLQFNGPPVSRDMKYNMFNIQRQRENFESIKTVAGKELTNDVYARDPKTDTFWFIGKVARVSGELSFEDIIWSSTHAFTSIPNATLSYN